MGGAPWGTDASLPSHDWFRSSAEPKCLSEAITIPNPRIATSPAIDPPTASCMPVTPRSPRYEPGAEPIAGYRLAARLGGGAAGEVWKAIGPGDFPVALKIVPLSENAVPPHDLVGETEGASLALMREIRHAHLLPLFGAWRESDHLIVGMELADRTLLDRCQEAQAAGLPGIPFPELMEYLQQAAEGIDFLNEPCHALGDRHGVALVHGDIKPQNLLLVGGSVKVGDFGLVQRLDEDNAFDPAGLTPAYAAPELFQSRLSRFADQYALALTYCRLRAGRLPFTGNSWELILKHSLDAPDLTMLSAGEQEVVGRALAKQPEHRWPSCRVFIRELLERGGRGPRRGPSRPPTFLPLMAKRAGNHRGIP